VSDSRARIRPAEPGSPVCQRAHFGHHAWIMRGREGRGGGDRSRHELEGEVREALAELARSVQARPENRAGADKAWVLRSMWAALILRSRALRAERVERP
jgi:hypothetical protein